MAVVAGAAQHPDAGDSRRTLRHLERRRLCAHEAREPRLGASGSRQSRPRTAARRAGMHRGPGRLSVANSAGAARVSAAIAERAAPLAYRSYVLAVLVVVYTFN